MGSIYKLYHKLKIRGETVWTDNKRYIGEYYDDKKHGEGIFEWGNGKRYEGKWENGKQHVFFMFLYF